MGISYIEMNEQKIPIEDEELREVVTTMQDDIGEVNENVADVQTQVENLQTQINTINNKTHLVIKTTSYTGTTDANGNLIIGALTFDKHILNIQCSSAPEGAYCFVVGRANNYWVVRVLSNHNDYLAVANKNMTLEIEYLVYE